MTRKHALSQAILFLQENNFEQEVIEKLKELYSDIPIVNWDEKTIFDSVDQFIEDNKRLPTATDFNYKKLPSHPTVKNRFKMTVKEFLDTYYRNGDSTKYKYKRDDADYWLEAFKEQCCKIGAPITAQSYEKNKDTGMPCGATLCKILNAKNWTELLEKAGIESFTLRNKIRPQIILKTRANLLEDTFESYEKRQETKENLLKALENIKYEN